MMLLLLLLNINTQRHTHTKAHTNYTVCITDNLSPEKHINKITGDTYQLLRNIRIAFKYLDEEMINKLIPPLIWPKLEYAAVIWSPNIKKDIRKIAGLQRTATKMAPSLRDLPFEKRFLDKLPTFQKKRERGDLIAVYRASKGLDKIDRDYLFVWDFRNTRGHEKKLKRNTCKRDTKQYSFPYRSIE